jgi:transposase
MGQARQKLTPETPYLLALLRTVDVDEYRLHRLTCPRCGVATRAELPVGVPTGPFGPRLRAILAMLAGSYRLGKRPIQQLASDLFGLTISLGLISNWSFANSVSTASK